MTDDDRAQDDLPPDEPVDEEPAAELVDDDRDVPRPWVNEIRLPRLRQPAGNSGPY